MPTKMMTKRSVPIYGFKTIGDPASGEFEAFVSVFNNVDLGGDRIIPGAFQNNLLEWKSSGDPIPVIWSHNWNDWRDHCGIVLEAKECLPGDPLLPPEIKELGGLWVRMKMDVEEEEPRRIAKLLASRRVKEFSFAYDVESERRTADGTNDLVELRLIEVGPTLKGMNPETQLLARKNIEELARQSGVSEEDVKAVLIATVEVDQKESPMDENKKSVTFVGAIEERQAQIYEMATAWALANDVGNGGLYDVHLCATFDDHAIILVEGWDDPMGEGKYFELPLSLKDGVLGMDDPLEVVIEGNPVPKNRPAKTKSTIRGQLVDSLSANEKDKAKSGKADESVETKTDDQVTKSESDSGDVSPSVLAKKAEIELAEAQL